MKIWAIADLHLSFSVPEKTMEVFGPEWIGYAQKIESNWKERICEDDLVLIAGDISWAMHLEQAKIDLAWIDQLPGTKVMIKGNHDYWWSSLSKVQKALPPSIHVIQNTVFNWKGVSVAGTRLWDTEEYAFDSFIEFKGTRPVSSKEEKKDQERIFLRELDRLELSLKSLDKKASLRIAMTHYPPIGSDLHASKVSALLEKYDVEICVFGHLHSLKQGVELFGSRGPIAYHLTSCDYLDFCPLQIFSS